MSTPKSKSIACQLLIANVEPGETLSVEADPAVLWSIFGINGTGKAVIEMGVDYQLNSYLFPLAKFSIAGSTLTVLTSNDGGEALSSSKIAAGHGPIVPVVLKFSAYLIVPYDCDRFYVKSYRGSARSQAFFGIGDQSPVELTADGTPFQWPKA